MKIKLEKTEKTVSQKMLSTAISIFLTFVSLMLVLVCIVILFSAFSKKGENTVQIFGYKVFYSQNDIEGTHIKSGSLIFIKNTDNDEYYTPEFLEQNAVLVIPKAGLLIAGDIGFMAASILFPFMLMFTGIIFWQLKILMLRREQNKMQTQIDFDK